MNLEEPIITHRCESDLHKSSYDHPASIVSTLHNDPRIHPRGYRGASTRHSMRAGPYVMDCLDAPIINKIQCNGDMIMSGMEKSNG